MPPGRRPKPRPNAANVHSGLQQRLTLLAWLHDRLGYTDTKQLLDDIRLADEGFDGDGRSYVYARLASRAGQLRDVTTADLERYDDNIREHLAAMNAGRTRPITLRYFQYLAALYTEMFLHRYSRSPVALLDSLNKHVAKLNSNRSSSEFVERYEESDLKKLAFWMATGSGKTLLMHLNYQQYLHYNRNGEAPDNILLITPNEGLSQQHLDELKASGIPARRFALNEIGLLGPEDDTVRVTEITKLVIEKRGEGETVPVEAFEGSNLIFVDEGHKGYGGEAWREVRDALGETGFTFEYSATFGQALTAARNDTLTMEYGKAIAFDYSYRYFYDDGYGKDFHLLNLRQETTAEQTETLLLANLLSFYEQQRVFTERYETLRPYNIDKPLWIFVGSSVNKKDSQQRSDVLRIARFLHHVLADSPWATETIDELLKGQSGLLDDSENDIFADKFGYLRQLDVGAPETYRDILDRVFHTSTGGGLHLSDIQGSDDELGLKASGAEDYFGVIYIGDTSEFKKLVEPDNAGIVLDADSFSGSLFDRINEPDTTIETLIGSRKFTEGWNSWRVSNMGLLNIGRSEGSQIIQLFGRGVRLRGRDMTLKRSSALDGDHPEQIRLLETLNIFAVRANYMSQFRDYLEREGVDAGGMLELPLFIRPNQDFLGRGLVIPSVDDGRDFDADTEILLEPVTEVRQVLVDMSASVQQLDSVGAGVADASAASGTERRIPPASLSLVDWESVYLAMLEHKERKKLGNLVVRPHALRRILEAEDPRPVYRLIAEEPVVLPKSQADREQLQEAVTKIVRKYADALYRHKKAQWASSHLVYKTLDEHHSNFRFNIREDGGVGRYIVRVPQSETQLIPEIKQLIADCNALYNSDRSVLPRIHFDRHLYQPLLVENEGRITTSPAGLTGSEQRFVKDLKEHWANSRGDLPGNAEVFLLRNQDRGKGVGFFNNSGFYPDFILWTKIGDAQRIVFVEPHGMLHEDAPEHSEKIRLYRELRQLTETMRERSGEDVTLDSYIVSETPYEALRTRWSGNWSRSDFANEHILFPERSSEYDYVAEIIESHATSTARASAASS